MVAGGADMGTVGVTAATVAGAGMATVAGVAVVAGGVDEGEEERPRSHGWLYLTVLGDRLGPERSGPLSIAVSCGVAVF